MTSDQEIKIELCQTMKELYAEGILTDIGGNLSFRSVDDDNLFWITPSGLKKNLVEPKHLIQMSLDGEVVSENMDMNPSVEWPMHLRIFKEDEDFKAIIHSHAPLATALSVLKTPPEIPPLTAELGFLVPEIVIVPYEQSGTEELGEAVADMLWDSSILILENHGVVAIGEAFREAAMKTRALEEYLRLYLNAKQFGGDIRKFPGFE
ncbi:MAG: class II aldolase/adducin family protein [Candidatus Heimdallarchaeota archaeon]|nr:MAG: class II aldolase/adducin family protein [Candidatus Heimdallarchaeota archaeon]